MYKIYHIVHIDRLSSIINNQGLFSDEIINSGNFNGTTIGMTNIKDRRLNECTIASHNHELYVGQCVPFYFCPRSVMLYMMHVKNENLTYKGGQEPIIHLVADLQNTVSYADKNNLRWAFTSSNAGSYFFESFSDLNDLSKLNWTAINANNWSSNRDAKQSEFLIENCFHWDLIEFIGVYDQNTYDLVSNIINKIPGSNKPKVGIKRKWYY